MDIGEFHHHLLLGLLHRCHGVTQIIQFALICVLILNCERCYYIYDSFFILYGVDPPIIHHEIELRYLLLCLRHFIILLEGISHHCDQHIQQDDAHEEGKAEKQNTQVNGHVIVQIGI